VRPIYNWAEEGDLLTSGTTDLSPYGLEGRFTFVFGGNMGIHQALDTAVEAALAAAAEIPEIRLVLVGGGVQAEALRRRAAEDGRDIVRVLPGIPRVQVTDLFAAAQVLLVHLADKPLYAVTVPSKTQFYLAVGKPVLAGLAGEAAELLKSANCGIVVPPEDAGALAAAMVKLARTPAAELAQMGANGQRFYQELLSFDRGMEQIVGVVDEAIGR
jgi:glycosyltransferase involved in cell wall biosynthesis